MHIPENEILLYLESKISHGRRTEIEKHLADCRECTDTLAELYSLLNDTGQERPLRVEPGYLKRAEALIGSKVKKNDIPSASAEHPVLVFIVSILVVAAVTLTFYYVSGQYDINPLRYRGAPEVNNILQLVPGDGATIGSERMYFGWNKINNAAGYRITIYDLNGNIVFKASTADTLLSPGDKNHFVTGRTYLWDVRVYLPDGRSIKSAVHSFKFLNNQ